MDRKIRELALFAGAGGGILGGILLGWKTVCAVEINPFCREVLLRRQMDGFLPRFPIWDDIRTFDGKPWRGFVDVITGGFPCQDISASGTKVGIEGERSSMWFQMARIIRDIRPSIAFVENSSNLTCRGFDRVLWELAEMGFDAEWGVLGASDAGARHLRKRIWILAYTDSGRCLFKRKPEYNILKGASRDQSNGCGEFGRWMRETPEFWKIEPDVGRVANGLAFGVDRLGTIGNGQVPSVVTLAFHTLAERAKKGGWEAATPIPPPDATGRIAG